MDYHDRQLLDGPEARSLICQLVWAAHPASHTSLCQSENADEMTAINALTNRVIANLPTSQAPQVVIGVCAVIRYIERVRAERSAPIVRPTCVLCIA